MTITQKFLCFSQIALAFYQLTTHHELLRPSDHCRRAVSQREQQGAGSFIQLVQLHQRTVHLPCGNRCRLLSPWLPSSTDFRPLRPVRTYQLAEHCWLLGHSRAPSYLTLAPRVQPVTPWLQLSTPELFLITAPWRFPHSPVWCWMGHISFCIQGSQVASEHNTVSWRAKGTWCNPPARS